MGTSKSRMDLDDHLLQKIIEDSDFKTARKLIDRIGENQKLLQMCFFTSIYYERAEIFQYILQETEVNLNASSENRESALHLSLKCSSDYFLKEILKKDILVEDKLYETILHNAVATNNPNYVEPFLKYGFATNNENILGITPLDIAIENNNFEIVSMFLYYNCDTSSRSGAISPFMYSMLCDSHPEIQFLLLEYEVDINNSDSISNNLFIAIKKCKHLIRGILEHGADVNQICNNRNIIDFIFENSLPCPLFALIWDKFDYEIWRSSIEESILIFLLNVRFIPKWRWRYYMKYIIESPKIQIILESQNSFLISSLVEEFKKRGLDESEFYDMICTLLVNGCRVYAIDLHKVYNLLGKNSKVLRLLIHMEIEVTHLNALDFNFIKIKYNFDTSVNQLIRNFLFNMRIFDMTTSYKDILRFFSVPPKVKKYLLNPLPCNKPFQITWNYVVPSLLELSRNEARDFLCKRYSIKNGGLYYSIVTHCDLPKVVKDLLLFEKPLYLHDQDIN